MVVMTEYHAGSMSAYYTIGKSATSLGGNVILGIVSLNFPPSDTIILELGTFGTTQIISVLSTS